MFWHCPRLLGGNGGGDSSDLQKNITLTYVKRHRYCNFYTEARKSRFLLQTGNTDNQYVTAMVFCQESREGRSGLQRGRCCIAKPALLHCRTAVTGMSGGPYGEITMSKTCVNEAGKAFLPFWFEKNKMRFFQNNIYITKYPEE